MCILCKKSKLISKQCSSRVWHNLDLQLTEISGFPLWLFTHWSYRAEFPFSLQDNISVKAEVEKKKVKTESDPTFTTDQRYSWENSM